jgi:spore coat protein CotF
MKIAFQTQFFNDLYNIKHNFYRYQILCITNTKTGAKQTHHP